MAPLSRLQGVFSRDAADFKALRDAVGWVMTAPAAFMIAPEWSLHTCCCCAIPFLAPSPFRLGDHVSASGELDGGGSLQLTGIKVRDTQWLVSVHAYRISELHAVLDEGSIMLENQRGYANTILTPAALLIIIGGL